MFALVSLAEALDGRWIVSGCRVIRHKSIRRSLAQA
jgi:hypothetical protein